MPLSNHKTLADYCRFLLNRFIVSEFKKGTSEVHLIFDNPDAQPLTPKSFEQHQRDTNTIILKDHCCDNLSKNTKIIPSKWRENFINCRVCKRSLVKFIGSNLLASISSFLQPHQTLVTAGCFEGDLSNGAWMTKGNNKPQPEPLYTCNANETDTRIWLHVRKTHCSQILVISPDTDVYHIGLPLTCIKQKNVIVQLHPLSSRELKYLDLPALLHALTNDPDLAGINPSILPRVLQTIFITSGCDYISFFSNIGKGTFLRYFFQYASFITANDNPNTPGTLSDTNLEQDSYENGFLAFIRLIGTVYFKKYSTGFNTSSPAVHYQSFIRSDTAIRDQHLNWLNNVRENIWHRIKFENEMIPSNAALYLHWKRTCWISHMWSQADINTMVLKPLTEYGWTLKDGKLTIVWDTEDNMKAVRQRVKVLLQGCKCKTGCTTARCKCKREGEICKEGCQCFNCQNIQVTPIESDLPEEIYLSLEELDDGDLAELDDGDLGDDENNELDEICELQEKDLY